MPAVQSAMRRRLTTACLFLLAGLATTLAVALGLCVFVDVNQGAASQAESLVDDERWTLTRYDRAGAAQLRSVRIRGLSWSPQQAAGEPDTPAMGDQVTAWASQSSDAGTEWLVLHYAKAVIPKELHVYESCGPGALFKVAALDDAGAEIEAWSGTDPSAGGAGPTTPRGVAISKVPLSVKFPANRIKIYLASDKVSNWNEVDAVALVSDAGETQWARHVQASSTYASASAAQAGASGNPALLAPAWTDLDRPRAPFATAVANREERLVDARGWPLLALRSEIDLLSPSAASSVGYPTSPPPANVGTGRYSSRQLTLTGTAALTTPAPGTDVRAPLPTRPIPLGLAVNSAVFALAWFTLWAALTIPRRFIRDLDRLRRGACIACGYDLGYDFPHGCPECGWRRDPAQQKRTTSP
jgi:hypothetical protein